jgi:solute carrier family 13 (sodium-dependent dicarboxylate transporter), member 2/3/5
MAMSPNPGILKLDLAIRGAVLDDSLRAREDLLRAPAVRSPVTRSLDLVLPGEVLVSAPIDEAFTRDSPYRLIAEDDHFYLQSEGERAEVRIVAPPSYYAMSTRSGIPMWRVGNSYGPYLAINPAKRCGFSERGSQCQFCDDSTQGTERDEPIPVDDVVDTVRAAFAEGAIDFVYLHIGYVDGEDAGVRFIEPYVRAIKRHFDTLVAVQLQPPRENRWIDYIYAIGVDAISYSVQIHDPDILANLCVGRAEQVGRDRYYEALRHAAAIFPNGTVWSDLIVGLEPIESTLAGVDALVDMGVLPVLSVFRPLSDTELRDHPMPATQDVAPVFAYMFERVREAGINMNWVRDLSFAVTPFEARFFADPNASLGGLGPLYRSRIGNLAVRNLSRLRRRLRVRKVNDSYGSSNL